MHFHKPTKIVFIILFLLLAGGLAAIAEFYAQNKPPSGNQSNQTNQNINKTSMKISTPAFQNGQPIPKQFTCQGGNINPALEFSGVPGGAKSLALIMHDPDAPRPGGFTHWVIYNMPPTTSSISENSAPSGKQGLNGAGQAVYAGPCPPSGAHRYYFKLYALDAALEFNQPPTKDELEQAMQGRIISQAELMGTYVKK